VDVIDLAKVLCPNGNETIFDIGANLGFMSLEFSLLVEKKGQVFSWEPHPSNYKLLDLNIRNNKRGNIKSFNNAVSDEDMTLCIPRFAGDVDVDAAADVADGKRPAGRAGGGRRSNNGDIKLSDRGSADTKCTGNEVPIKTMKLDFVTADIQDLNFIKIGTYRKVLLFYALGGH
jgi:FkbM family methyltransferase